MRLDKRKVKHKDFYSISRGYNALPVVIFDRKYFQTAKPKPFTKADVKSMLRATKRSLKEYDLFECWGGVGEVYFSVLIKHKTRVWHCEGPEIFSKAHSLPLVSPELATRL